MVDIIIDGALDDPVSSVLDKKMPSVLIYITTPPSADSQEMQDNHLYEMDDPYPSGLHTDLKRDLHELNKRQSDDDIDFQGDLGLFEKYQFFTPGMSRTMVEVVV